MASPSSLETLLQSALTALKQRDYATAIATFSTLQHHGDASTAQRLKAEMGLVRAYMGQGDTTTAIALCQRLQQRPQAKVKAWATQMLQTLPSAPIPSAATQTPDSSGFQPLTASPGPKDAAEDVTEDATGFVPLTGEAPPEVVAPPPMAQPPTTAPAAPSPLDPSDSKPPGTGLPAAAPSSNLSGPSLFHYQTLNHGLTPPEASQAGVEGISAPQSAPPSAGETGASAPPAHPPQSGPSAAAAASEAAPPAAEPALDAPWQLVGAGRLERLRSLGQPSGLWQLWLTQALTLGLSLVLMDWLLHRSLRGAYAVLRRLSWVVPQSWLGGLLRDHTVPLLMAIAVLALASPWLWDRLLTLAYQQQPLSISRLQTTHPETVRLLRRLCQQRGWPMPHLRSLPTALPLSFSYGWWPSNLRLVVSQGWLQTLSDDEAATLLGHELAHLHHGTLPLMSTLGLLLQLLYQGYWHLARWGDRQNFAPLRASGALLSALAYGLYWLLRKPCLGLTRLRTTHSDRQAVEWTGNPNGLVRALVKTATATATTVAAQGQTPPLAESVDLLTPLGYRSALTPGSLYPQGVLPTILTWDWQNPYRHWLALNSAHPLLGDRLVTLSRYAAQWGLATELDLPQGNARLRLRSRPDFAQYWVPFALQISPYIGPLLGVLTTLILWFVGGVVNPLGLWQISWFYGDRSLLWGSLGLGLGIGILVRINRYFPDINPTNTRRNPPLAQLLNNPMALPTDSVPVRLEGTLLGRRGMANWLCQDFWLQTEQGLIKLHFLSSLGAVGNLLLHPGHPSQRVGQTLTASGWFRRGAAPWLDVDAFLKPGQRSQRSNHPVWSASLALASCGLGILIIFRGG